MWLPCECVNGDFVSKQVFLQQKLPLKKEEISESFVREWTKANLDNLGYKHTFETHVPMSHFS